MQGFEEPLPRHFQGRLNGLFLITEDRLGVAQHLSNALAGHGVLTYIIERENCLSIERIREEIHLACNLLGPVTGIIHLAGLCPMPISEDIDTWREETFFQCKSLFHILRICSKDLQATANSAFKRVLCASMLGGAFGRDGLQAGLPLAGFGQGLLKSLEQEWDYVMPKAIDFDQSLSPEEISGILFDELRILGGRLELGYPKGKRTVFLSKHQPIEPGEKVAGLHPQSGWVVLVTGGARGITAEAVKTIAHMDMDFILVGRSHLLAQSEYWKYLPMSEAEVRQSIIQVARESGEKVSPRTLEGRVSRIIRDREIRNNISQLQKLGLRVHYRVCDVSDPMRFGQEIASIYQQFGKIDLVIHGAGVIDDYLLVDKEAKSLDTVFDTKVNSAFALYHHLQMDSLKGLIFFSSTAGRFGNKGQADYAAANEVLNRMAWHIRARWPHLVVKSLNWGPWIDVGMASQAVNSNFLDKGIVPISATEGQQYFLSELLLSNPDEVEVVWGEGTWNSERPDGLRTLFQMDLFSSGIGNS